MKTKHIVFSRFSFCTVKLQENGYSVDYVQLFGMEKQTRLYLLGLKLSPCSECSMLSSGQFPGV
jgi:hypothetical protein